MADHTVRAVVLRRSDSGESDRRLTLLTREFGKLDVVAKGARKGGSRLAGSSDPLCESILTYADGRRTRFVTQTEPVNSFRGLREDYERLTQALALAELVAGLLPFEQPDESLYEFLIGTLSELSTHPKPLVVFLWAEVKILAQAGFEPQWLNCVISGEPISAEAFVSPQAGGVVSDLSATRFTDRVRAKAEVLIALSRLRELDSPPANVRYANACFLTLYPFLRAAVDLPLPAHEAVRDSLLISENHSSSVK